MLITPEQRAQYPNFSDQAIAAYITVAKFDQLQLMDSIKNKQTFNFIRHAASLSNDMNWADLYEVQSMIAAELCYTHKVISYDQFLQLTEDDMWHPLD